MEEWKNTQSQKLVSFSPAEPWRTNDCTGFGIYIKGIELMDIYFEWGGQVYEHFYIEHSETLKHASIETSEVCEGCIFWFEMDLFENKGTVLFYESVSFSYNRETK